MGLHDWLIDERDAILDDAERKLLEARLPHYPQAGTVPARRRLSDLLDLTTACSYHNDLVTISFAMAELGADRFLHGYPLGEVQTAMNSLEETIWQRLVTDPSRQATLADDLRAISTVLGVAKDRLAQTYVSLAARSHVPAVDVEALAAGTSS
jgi:hypothetical protein